MAPRAFRSFAPMPSFEFEAPGGTDPTTGDLAAELVADYPSLEGAAGEQLVPWDHLSADDIVAPQRVRKGISVASKAAKKAAKKASAKKSAKKPKKAAAKGGGKKAKKGGKKAKRR